ncbi:MAG: leucine-rich repeat protein [Butyrivibrio sp.]|nr:leucine-rich repeat protein [Muribaculum sp.]MCM1552688.1 leucine-rich repeat protein [Butyrivibrio sp.]
MKKSKSTRGVRRVLSSILAVIMVLSTFMGVDGLSAQAAEVVQYETDTNESEVPEKGSEIGELREGTTDGQAFFNVVSMSAAGDAEVSRIQWLTELTTVFEMTVEEDNYPDNYYSDITSDDANYYEVMLATEFGLVDVEAGDPFCPNDAATREFAAHTLNLCMGYMSDEGVTYTFNEKDAVTYPDDIQIAIDKGWIALSGGDFLPEQGITTAEKDGMIAEAAKAIERTRIDENYDNKYEFLEDVIVIPNGTEASVSGEDELTIYNCGLEIKAGDKFVIFSGDLPIGRRAVSVESVNDSLVIKMESVETAEIFAELDIQGKIESDLTQVHAVNENAEISYFVGGTKEKNFSDGVEYSSLEAVGNSKISAVQVKETYDVSDEFRNTYGLEKGKKVEIYCRVFDQYADYSSYWNKKVWNGKANAYFIGELAVSFHCNVSVDALEDLGISNGQTICKVNIDPLGIISIDVKLELEAKGEVMLEWSGYISAGIGWDNESGFYLQKNFNKKSFTIAAKVEVSMGIRAEIKFDVGFLKGSAYAEAGAKSTITSTTYIEDEPPYNCTHMRAHLYVVIGCSAKLDLGVWKESWSKDCKLISEVNSPVRVVKHYEDGLEVPYCTRDNKTSSEDGSGSSITKKYKYYTPFYSRYAQSGINSGTGSNGQPYTIFEYSKGDGDQITITKFNGNVSALSIPESIDGYTVTAIGGNAFKGNTKLHMVVIPDTVTEIGSGAFSGCSNLANAILSKSLTSLGDNAFYNCDELESIEIPKTLKGGDNVIFYGNRGAFNGCSKLKDVKFEDGVTEICGNLFSGCDGLEKIVIPETVTKIQPQAFESSGLSEIIIPNSVTEIKSSAFKNCKKLSAVKIPNSVVSIGSGAFSECSSLANVILSKSLTSLGDNAFYNCDELESIEIPKTLKGGDNVIFYGNRGAFNGCSKLKDVKFEDGVTEICGNLFSGCDGLEKIVIPETVTKIQPQAFESSGLSEIIIPNSVTEIKSSAFKDCTRLNVVEMPDSVTFMGTYIFSGCTKLTTVKLPSERVNIAEGTFKDCTSLIAVTLPETVEAIRKYAFQNCTSLANINFPASLVTIEERAFDNNTALAKAQFGEQLQTIATYAFHNCDTLTSITIPDSVTTIGTYCFADCEVLKDLNLGTGLTEIPAYAFNLCPALESVVLPYRIATVKDNAFTNCTKLTELTVPRGTMSIGTNAVSYPTKMTVYGISGTYAQEWADKVGATFVNREISAATVTLNKGELTMIKGKKETLVMSVAPANFTDEVVWKSSDETIATVSDAGIVTAKGLGEATLRVTVGNMSASCKVLVVQPVTSISLNKTSLSLEAMETYTLTASVGPGTANDKTVTWSTSDENVVAVEQTGVVTALRKGTATITVTANDGSGVSRSCTVTVTSSTVFCESLEQLESLHNYENDCKDVWVYTLTGADSLNVTFDERTNIEEDFDYLYIYDGKGTLIGKYTGTQLAGKTVQVTGDTIKIKLDSDKSGNAWGFKVASITKNGEGGASGDVSGGNAGGGTEGGDGGDDNSDIPQTGLHVKLLNGSVYTYTGSAIKPSIRVTNNGVRMTEGVDYTVQYSNNVKASNGVTKENALPKITVTGRGNYSGKASVNFSIDRKSLTGLDNGANNLPELWCPEKLAVALNTKASPVLFYDGRKLGSKDYDLSTSANSVVKPGKITADCKLYVIGKGNYTGAVAIEIKAVEKNALKKLSVSQAKGFAASYDGREHRPVFGQLSIGADVEVTAKGESDVLQEGRDYYVVFPADTVSAGTVKYSVIGMGEYSGIVTKSYKITPLKASESEISVTFAKQSEGYPYSMAGVTVSKLAVTYHSGLPDEKQLVAGQDYKVSYSGNKKVGTAKLKITFLGNYKGSRQQTSNFKIHKANLDEMGQKVVIAVSDKIYKKAGVYKSMPSISIDGVMLKSSDYAASYEYKDAAGQWKAMDKGNKLDLNLMGMDSVTARVVIIGKGNFNSDIKHRLTKEYRICKPKEGEFDLSKAKVTFYDKNNKKVTKLTYTGEEVTPYRVEVVCKGSNGNVTLADNQYTINYVNNVNKGRATVVLTGTGVSSGGDSFVGSKNVAFNIVSMGMKGNAVFDNLSSAQSKLLQGLWQWAY